MVQKFNKSPEIFVGDSFKGKNKARLKRKETETTKNASIEVKGNKNRQKSPKNFCERICTMKSDFYQVKGRDPRTEMRIR